MRFCSLGSGSAGNAMLLEWSHEGKPRYLLLDCGFSERELGIRLAGRGLSIKSLDAILITHEHGDHLGKAPSIAAKHQGAALEYLRNAKTALAFANHR